MSSKHAVLSFKNNYFRHSSSTITRAKKDKFSRRTRLVKLAKTLHIAKRYHIHRAFIPMHACARKMYHNLIQKQTQVILVLKNGEN